VARDERPRDRIAVLGLLFFGAVTKEDRKLKYLSLFSGIGGFELGIQRAYEEIQRNLGTKPTNKKSRQTEPEVQLGRKRSSVEEGHSVLSSNNGREWPICVGYSEIDKYAIQIYEERFKHENYGDITKIKASKLLDFDLLVGGFPCQAFSIAGKRLGFEDTRGTLFFDIVRILKAKFPRLFVLENVKGLLSHDNGRTFRTIITTLDELRYDLQWQVLNSKNFGVPQNRERVFIVGHLRGTPRPKVFPIGEGNEVSYKENRGKQESGQRVRGEISSTIDARYGALRNAGETYLVAPNKKQIDLSQKPKEPFQLLEVRTEKGKQTRKEIWQRRRLGFLA